MQDRRVQGGVVATILAIDIRPVVEQILDYVVVPIPSSCGKSGTAAARGTLRRSVNVRMPGNTMLHGGQVAHPGCVAKFPLKL
jgi:hypothetical protein